jgi:hypothetical protein
MLAVKENQNRLLVILSVTETGEHFLMELDIVKDIDTIMRLREACEEMQAQVFYEDETSHLYIKLPTKQMFELCNKICEWIAK